MPRFKTKDVTPVSCTAIMVRI